MLKALNYRRTYFGNGDLNDEVFDNGRGGIGGVGLERHEVLDRVERYN